MSASATGAARLTALRPDQSTTPTVAAPSRFADLPLRCLSSFVLVAVSALYLWMGGPFVMVLAAGAAAVMVWELSDITRAAAWQKGLAIAAAGLAPMIAAVLGAGSAAAGLLAVATLLCTRAPWLGAGLFYVGLAMVALVSLHASAGAGALILVVAVVVAVDVGAYFVGRAVGGRKLWPAVSPGKTWAGLWGGVAAAMAVGGVAAVLWRGPAADTIALCLALGLAAAAGDLLESGVKRRFGVKDSSTLIPGHGGFLDRLDGLLAALLLFAGISAL